MQIKLLQMLAGRREIRKVCPGEKATACTKGGGNKPKTLRISRALDMALLIVANIFGAIITTFAFCLFTLNRLSEFDYHNH
jgi:hypothetical protein